ncbi:MAG: hypothetical protein FD150_1082 [Rhodobacteraceae bacterium]|nr:MAG: hypothetical protein FD150_1082 [Paracoccaceae bacterium]
MGVVVDAERVRHGQEDRVSLGYRGVLAQFVDQLVRLAGVAAAEDGAGVVDDTNLVLFGATRAEVHPVEIVGDGKDRAADRGAGRSWMPGGLPGFAELADLGGLLNM